jgi:hypothetical protein
MTFPVRISIHPPPDMISTIFPGALRLIVKRVFSESEPDCGDDRL